MKQFTHLHLHTHYSLLDGMSRMPELMDRAMELGFSAIGTHRSRRTLRRHRVL